MPKIKLSKFRDICPLPTAMSELQKNCPVHPQTLSDITWRIFRIMSEFVEGFQFLSETKREISIFGSTRTNPNDHWYKEAEKLAYKLGKAGFTIITGGGEGIMAAANKGASDAGAQSIGLNIELPLQQRMNKYVKTGRGFHYFFTRKVMLSASSQAYIFFPGGFGTLDEFFEMIMLIQTKKAQKVPVVIVGKEFWTPLISWMQEMFIKKYKSISSEDMKLFNLVDTAEDAFKLVKNSKERSIF